MEALRHNNIVTYYGSVTCPMSVIMEVCQGTCSDLISAKRMLNLDEVSHILFQILQGIVYMHGKEIVHR